MNNRNETGSALLMGMILLTFFALLSSTIFNLTRDTVGMVRRTAEKNQCSEIAESILNKVVYQMHNTFTGYYSSEPNSASLQKIDWFSEVTGNTIGAPDFLYTIPAAGSQAYEFLNNSSIPAPEQWSDAKFDVTIDRIASTEINAHYKIRVSAYQGDNTSSRATIEEVRMFGFSDAEVFDYLIYSDNQIHINGEGEYYGDIKSNDSVVFSEGPRWKPSVLGSVHSAGGVYGYDNSGNPIENQGNYFYRWNNIQYRNWTSNWRLLNSMSRPFQPSVRFNVENQSQRTNEMIAENTNTWWKEIRPTTPAAPPTTQPSEPTTPQISEELGSK